MRNALLKTMVWWALVVCCGNASAQQPAYTHLDVNNVDMLLTVYGGCHYAADNNHLVSGYEFPKGSGCNTLSACGLWLSGHDLAQQIIYAFASDFRRRCDFSPGPLTDRGYTNDEISAYYNRVWTISRSEMDLFLSFWDENTHQFIPQPDYIIPSDIWDWPAHGWMSVDESQGHLDYYIAPFVDVDGDGYYAPEKGEYPQIKGDKCAFFVFNTCSPHSMFDGCEIQGMAYAFDEPDDPMLNNTVFFDFKIMNKGGFFLEDFYVGLWCDFDIGHKYDDYVGCDVENNCFYAYNASSVDGNGETGSYGANPPCQVVTLLRGIQMEDMDEPLGMTNFMYYTPEDLNEAGIPFCNYCFQRSRWYQNRLQYGGTGHAEDPAALSLDCRYAFPGDSDPQHLGTNGTAPWGIYSETPWTEKSCGNTPGDRLCVGSMGPFSIQHGDVMELSLALTSFADREAVWQLSEPIDHLKHCFETGYTSSGNPFAYYYNVEENVVNQQVEIHPNPTTGLLTIKMTDFQSAEIIDLMGRKVAQSNDALIDLSKLPQGIYLVKVFNKEGACLVRKVVKE